MLNLIFNSKAIEIESRICYADFDLPVVMDMEKDIAYISGSVVEGFGNPASDVDIYVITDKNPLLLEGMKFAYTNSKHGYFNELIVYHYDHIYKICDIINNKEYDLNANEFIDNMELYYRCAIGVPMLNEAQFFETTKGFSKQVANEVYAEYHKMKCQEKLRLMKLLLNQQRPELVYPYAMRAIAHAIDYWTAVGGEGYESNKFRFLKLERLCSRDSEMYKRCWNLHSIGNRNHASYFSDVEVFCREVVPDILTEFKEVIYTIAESISNVEMMGDYLVDSDNKVYKMSRSHKTILDKLRTNANASSRNDLLKCFDDQSAMDSALEDLLRQNIVTIQ